MIMHIRIKLLMYKDQTESRHFIVKEEQKRPPMRKLKPHSMTDQHQKTNHVIYNIWRSSYYKQLLSQMVDHSLSLLVLPIFFK